MKILGIVGIVVIIIGAVFIAKGIGVFGLQYINEGGDGATDSHPLSITVLAFNYTTNQSLPLFRASVNVVVNSTHMASASGLTSVLGIINLDCHLYESTSPLVTITVSKAEYKSQSLTINVIQTNKATFILYPEYVPPATEPIPVEEEQEPVVSNEVQYNYDYVSLVVGCLMVPLGTVFIIKRDLV